MLKNVAIPLMLSMVEGQDDKADGRSKAVKEAMMMDDDSDMPKFIAKATSTCTKDDNEYANAGGESIEAL